MTPGNRSLREAIELANASLADEQDYFQSSVVWNGSNDQLIQSTADDHRDVEIIGPGANLLTLDAGLGGDGVFNGNGFRHFHIEGPGQLDVAISSLNLTGGDLSGYGGSIFNVEKLTLDGVAIRAMRPRSTAADCLLPAVHNRSFRTVRFLAILRVTLAEESLAILER